jgi:TatA/E family protein of Tat protein translocase
VLALVLFGAKRLPQVGKAAGEAIREFKSAFSGANNGGANNGGANNGGANNGGANNGGANNGGANNGGANNSGGVIAGSGSAGGQTTAPAADEARLDAVEAGAEGAPRETAHTPPAL